MMRLEIKYIVFVLLIGMFSCDYFQKKDTKSSHIQAKTPLEIELSKLSDRLIDLNKDKISPRVSSATALVGASGVLKILMFNFSASSKSILSMPIPHLTMNFKFLDKFKQMNEFIGKWKISKKEEILNIGLGKVSIFDIKMVQLDADWNDLGSWDAVWQSGAKDENQNVSHVSGYVASICPTRADRRSHAGAPRVPCNPAKRPRTTANRSVRSPP